MTAPLTAAQICDLLSTNASLPSELQALYNMQVLLCALVNNANPDVVSAIADFNQDFVDRVNTLGQKLSSQSIPVVISSDQSPLPVSASFSGPVTQGPGGASAWKVDGSAVTQPVSGTFFQATQPVSGTVSAVQSGVWSVTTTPPVGASTSALQTTGNTSLASIDGKIVAVNTGAVVISGALPTGTNTIGKVDQGTGGASAWKVDGSAVTQPVSGTVAATQSGVWSVTTTPPVGAATEAKQDVGNAFLSSIDGNIIICDTNNVDIISSVLPTGASTSALQVTGNSLLSSIDSNIVICDTGAVVVTTLPSLPTGTNTIGKVDQGTGGASAWKVDGSAVTQPVSGTFFQATQPVSLTSTTITGTVAATQSGTWTVQPGNTANTTAWKVDGSAVTQPVSGTFFQATQPISVVSLPLPSGASTSALQTTGNTSLSSIDGKIVAVDTGAVTISTALPAGTNAIGKLAANSGVIIGAVEQAGVWTVTASFPAGASTLAEQQTQTTSLQLLDDVVATDGSAALTKLFQVGGTDGTDAQILSTNVSGHLNIADGGNSITVDGTFFQATQPVSAASLPLPSGASTSALQTTGNTSLASIDGKIVAVNTGAVVISGALPTGTNTIGKVDQGTGGASAWKVDGSAVTQPVSLTSTTITGTVAATQSGTWTVQPGNTANTTAWKVDGSAVTQPVSGTFFQAIQPVSGTFFQATQPVSGTFFQATQPVSAASLPLPTGASTSAKQPALGIAGTASSDVITVQGIASMTALKVDGSAVTQPVSLTSTTITGTVAATQSGTWTVQPGNTANTTAWKVDGSAITQPVSLASTTITGTVTVGSHAVTNAGTFAVQAAVAGDVASDGVDSGNPVKIGMQARDTVITAVSSADRVNAVSNLYGSQHISGASIPTYVNVTATFTPVASATDIWILKGSATKTVRLLRVFVNGTQTTAGIVNNWSLVMRSTANTGGSLTSSAFIPLDSNYPAATATVSRYSANPTSGTLVGSIYAPLCLIPAPSSLVNVPTIMDFDLTRILNGHPVVLRGVAESVCLNLATTVATGLANVIITSIWTEQ